MPTMRSIVSSSLVFACLLGAAAANDPADSWLSYAVFTSSGKITQLNTSWVVPNNPASSFGSNAPGWWFGIQTTKGDGALVQPILAYGYQGNFYTMFNGVFDWTDASWHTSDEKYTVKPGDTLTSYVQYKPADNSYDMYIASKNLGKSILTNYKLESGQTGIESTAYFVLEHQPDSCKAYPADGVCTFENIYLEVDNKPVTPTWEAKQQQPACNSKAVIVDPKTIKFTWDPKAAQTVNASEFRFPPKWGANQSASVGSL